MEMLKLFSVMHCSTVSERYVSPPIMSRDNYLHEK
jgi:hypothetical protein